MPRAGWHVSTSTNARGGSPRRPLRAQLMETIGAANSALIRQFQEATAETVGAETETGRMLLASLRKRFGEPDE